ncbi:UNVERIFIED_CONTAM: hypothetical protein GTU68_039857 [Idotea baltica]|nr:hypothetical protein [Idotea baltica]
MEIHIPAAYTKLHHSKVDWAYATIPQKHVNNRVMHQPRGKALGGCSSTNCMAYIRGNKKDYDEWEGLGNTGWSYEEVLPYFKKSENNEQFNNEFHGQGGPLNVTQSKDYRSPVGQSFIDSMVELGYSANPDFNGVTQEGAGFFQFTIKDFKRCSTAVSFLKLAQSRPNLTVITHAHTTKVLIESGKAVGIEYLHKGRKLKELHAEKEVILAAGAFASPHLLMLSGIGPADHLREKGISPLHDLQGVGQNLQDHLITGISSHSTQKNSTFNTQETLGNLLKYVFTKKGPFGASPLEANAFVKTNPELDRPDMQFHFAPAHGNDLHDHSSFPKNIDGYSILPTLIRPKSIGQITLASNNPTVMPLIDPRYFEAQEDLAVMMEGMRIARAALLSEAFGKFRKNISYPSSYQTDSDLLKHLLEKVETCYHPVGTCKMGSDEMAVVDNELKVHGIDRLRVVDASIMPTIISGNTNAPTIMIAEKAADMIQGKKSTSIKKKAKIEV